MKIGLSSSGGRCCERADSDVLRKMFLSLLPLFFYSARQSASHLEGRELERGQRDLRVGARRCLALLAGGRVDASSLPWLQTAACFLCSAV